MRCLLDEVFANQCRVPRCAARADYDSPGLEKLVLVVYDAAEYHIFLPFVNAAAYAGPHGFRLLENLFEHKMRVAAFFELVEIQLQGL